MTSAQEKYLSSLRGSAELVRSMPGGGAFSNADLLRTLSEERRDSKKEWYAMYESKLKGLVRGIKGTDKRLLLRAKIIGAWLSVHSTTVSGTILSATEFRDCLCARYNVSHLNLQSHCDMRGTASGAMHTLSCSIGGLVIARHNEIHDELFYLS